MGYTHYYEVKDCNKSKWQQAWAALIQDTHLIIAAADVLLCENEDRDLPRVDVHDGILLNGVAHEAHEPFKLKPRKTSRFCKTSLKPYDLVVSCILLRAFMIAPEIFHCSSDGDWSDEWMSARELYEELWPDEKVTCPWQRQSVDEDLKPDADNNKNDGHPETGSSSPPTPLPPMPISVMTGSGVFNKAEYSTSELLTKTPDSRSTIISAMDFSFVKEWLSECNGHSEHGSCKPSDIQWLDHPGVQFRVIDTQSRRITVLPRGSHFLALSYVWGGVEQPKLTKATEHLLTQDKGLDAVWDQLPRTVRDAICLCEQICQRYLWVDALCIIQDSPRDMKIQILRMRNIYSAATCVIVAVSAESAAGGLLGNSTPPRSSPADSEDALYDLIDSSAWSKRAWCYQEKVLSHRVLLFTSDGVYAQCQQGVIDWNGRKLQPRNKLVGRYNSCGGMLLLEETENVVSYVSAVEYYSQRELTHQEDKLRAFQGILHLYSGTYNGKPSNFYCGLPITAFDQTFCWRTRQHNPHLRNTAFPTWSWLGWNDAVRFDRALINVAQTRHMICGPTNGFAKLDPDYDSSLEVRKACPDIWNISLRDSDEDRFGFPSASGLFSGRNTLELLGSVATLLISSAPLSTHGSNGKYGVFPMQCSQYIDEEADTRSYFIFGSPTSPEDKVCYSVEEHNEHGACEAKTPFGYIWLDQKWREQRPENFAADFLAIAGEKDPERPREWLITISMLLDWVDKVHWPTQLCERVQTMDCRVEERQWLSAGGGHSVIKIR